MGKLLHDRLTIYAQRNNFYGVEHCLRWARGSPESGQMVCAWKGEPEMAKFSIRTISCMRLTSRFLLKHTLEREELPCCFLESYIKGLLRVAYLLLQTLNLTSQSSEQHG